MSNYTINIKELLEQDNNLFDFSYPFYNELEGAKKQFEEKFINVFMYHEIGFDDVEMFKHYLKTKLVTLYPYYYQLYQTELRCKDIDFMLNKDLTETFKRDLTNELLKTGTNEGNTTESSNITATLVDDYSETNNSHVKDSSVSNGVSSSELSDGYLTSVQNTDNSNQYDLTESNTSEIKGNNTSSSTETINENNSVSETTELISKGNIGITSSAELLEKWRRVIIDIDMMLINDLATLFLKIY